jgi:hypothetical protein
VLSERLSEVLSESLNREKIQRKEEKARKMASLRTHPDSKPSAGATTVGNGGSALPGAASLDNEEADS